MEKTINSYLEQIKKVCPQISDNELLFFIKGLTVTKLHNKDYYIEANEIQKNIGFVHKGLLRCFYTKDDLKEITHSFVKEGDFITHYPSFISQEPSKYSFQCLEPSVIINIPRDHMLITLERNPSSLLYLSQSIGKAFSFHLERLESFLFDNAETRYLKFVDENKDLLNRISISHLSSYLGVERQTLTRIRKKLSRK